MKNRLVTVLDFGSTKVAGLTVERADNGSFVVKASASNPCTGMKRGLISDQDEVLRSVVSVLKQLSNSVGQPIEFVVACVSGPHYQGVNGQGYVPIFPRNRPITREDVMQVMKHSRQVTVPENMEQIQAVAREFRVDNERGVSQPIGMSGARLEATTYIVTGNSAQVKLVEEVLLAAGVKVEMMVVGALASGIAVLEAAELADRAVVIDVGGDGTDIGVFERGSIAFCGYVPIGGQTITSDLSKLLKTTTEEAERLKKESGASLASLAKDSDSVEVTQLGQTQARPMQRRVLCEIIESRMREISVFAKKEIERSGLSPRHIVVTGAGASLDGVADLFGATFPEANVRAGGSRLVSDTNLRSAQWACAIGMARYASESSEDELSTASVDSWKDRIRTLWSLISGK